MSPGKERSEWWRRFLDLPQDKSRKAVDILQQRYVEEMQQSQRFRQYSEKMHYPQFREKLFHIATEKTKHAERIAQKILALGAKLPSVPELRSTDENSWRQLTMALEEENRSADKLVDQLRDLESDYPDVTQFLLQIAEEQKKHRADITHMLMRSDPFAFSLA